MKKAPAPRATSRPSSPADSCCSNQLMTLVDAALAKQEQDEKRASTPVELKVVSPHASESSSGLPNNSLCNTSSSSSVFLERLRKTLDSDTIDVLQWMPSGDAFHIANPKKFVKNELQDIFRFKNMSSFLRKLNQLGFQRSLDKLTMNLDIFQHAEFVRGVENKGDASPSPNTPPASTPRISKRSLPISQTLNLAKTSSQRCISSMAVKKRFARQAAQREASEAPLQQPCLDATPRQYTPSLPARVSPELHYQLLNLLQQQAQGQQGSSHPPCMPSIAINAVDPLVQTLLHEREALLKGMDHMSLALSSLLLKQAGQQVATEHQR